METGFLNFHDEEHFSDFSLSLDHQHNLLGESQSSLVQMVDNDFDYVESLGLDSNDALWETEQELNGDLAILPVSGVAGVIPKMENIKEDFTKVLTEWQEHIGYLQASEIEEDINFDMGLHINGDLDDFFDSIPKPTEDILSSPVKLEEPSKQPDYALASPIKFDIHGNLGNQISESEQSEKEIDVVGLDSVEDVDPIIDYMHVRRQHANTSSKEHNPKTLGKKACIKQELVDIVVKEEPIDFEEEKIHPVVPPLIIKTEYIKNSKKKHSKKHKEDGSSKKSRKESKVYAAEVATKVSKKSKKEIKSEEFIQETISSNNDSTSTKLPVLEAGDVKSLLEQFEATEAAAVSSQAPETTQVLQPASNKTSKPSVNKSQPAPIKKENSKIHKDIRDSLPKEVIDRIKASGRKKTISVIPPIPNTKPGRGSSSAKTQEAASHSRSKVVKPVSNNSNNSTGRVDGSVQLDHDYCSNSKTVLKGSTSNSSSSSSLGSSPDTSCEYDKQNSDSEPLTPIKEDSNKEKNGCYGKGAAEHAKTGSQKGNTLSKKNSWTESSSRKDSGLESGDVSDASEEQQPASKLKQSPLQDAVSRETQTRKNIPQVHNDNNSKLSLLNKPNTPTKPVYEMKIQSALATSILQLRKGVLTKTKTLDMHKPKQQMVSVLKKPPVATTPQIIPGTNLKESIVTTTNSSNDQVQNIIVQEAADVDMPEETEKKPPRRKLNLAEYRSRREQTRDGSRTNSPVQPTALLYIHHASTNTEPINDDPENPIWCEREIVPVLKPKAEIEEEKVKPKPPTRDRGIQTMESVFGIVYEEEPEEEPEEEHEEGEITPQEEEQQMLEEQLQSQPPPQEVIKEQTVEQSLPVAHMDIVQTDEIESAQVLTQKNVNNDVTDDKVPVDEVQIVKDTVVNENNKGSSFSLGRMRDRKNRNYRRARASSGSSVSRSRSRSRSRGVRSNMRRASRSRSRSSRGRSRSKARRSRDERSRSRSRSRSHSRSRSRSTSSDRSRSRSRSRSHARRRTRRRRISHRRSSVSSSSSWTSRSRSRSRSRSSRRSRYSSSSRSRSRSRSRSSRYSSCSRSSSRSNFGRSKWSSRRRRGRRDRRRSYSRHRRHSSGSSHGYNDWRRSPVSYRRPYDDWYVREKQRQVEERRVIYVGRLKEGITKAELRKRFEVFGPVVDISVHFRERGHNYGFVTFANKNDAYQAVEHGNDDPSLPRYDLCFGGRRAFCKVKYADLDGATNSLTTNRSNNMFNKHEEENTFDLLLKEAQAKLRKRKV